jgi:hypothetical protein
MGESIKVDRAEFSTLSLAIFNEYYCMAHARMPTPRVENSAQVLSC